LKKPEWLSIILTIEPFINLATEDSNKKDRNEIFSDNQNGPVATVRKRIDSVNRNLGSFLRGPDFAAIRVEAGY
jgi:hypothetical protein